MQVSLGQLSSEENVQFVLQGHKDQKHRSSVIPDTSADNTTLIIVHFYSMNSIKFTVVILEMICLS